MNLTKWERYPPFNPKYMKNNMYMEDVQSIAVSVDNLIEKELEKFTIYLTYEQEDEIHNCVWKILESVSNSNYRHEI